MRDLSLHILDLAQNSVRANATVVALSLTLDEKGLLTLVIADDGCGMDAELLSRVQSPFATTRTTRKVGLGIPMMMENCRLTGGDVTLESQVGKGTTLTATLDTHSIDCLPLGDLASTVATIIMGSPDSPEFALHCKSPAGEMRFSTEDIRPVLQGVSLAEPSVVRWIQESLQEEIEPILGGITA